MPEPTPSQNGTRTDQSQVQLPAELTGFLELKDGQWCLKGNVDGQPTSTPLDIVTAQVQKLDAADQRLAEASRTLKSSRSKVDLADKVIASFNGDDDAARAVMEYFGEDVDATPARPTQGARPASNSDSGPSQFELPSDLKAFINDWNDLKANYGDPRNVFGAAVGLAHQNVKTELKSRVRSTVLANNEFKKFVQGKAPETVNAYIDEVFESVEKQMQRGAPDGAQTYVQAIRETAQRLKRLGVAGESSQTPTPEETARRALGLGPSAGSGGFGSSEIASGGKRPEAITPIGQRPGEHARNLMARLNHDYSQKLQAQGAQGE